MSQPNVGYLLWCNQQAGWPLHCVACVTVWIPPIDNDDVNPSWQPTTRQLCMFVETNAVTQKSA